MSAKLHHRSMYSKFSGHADEVRTRVNGLKARSPNHIRGRRDDGNWLLSQPRLLTVLVCDTGSRVTVRLNQAGVTL